MSNTPQNYKDKLYQQNKGSVENFSFDRRVADVFADMISRSVPGYQQILELLPTMVRQFSFTDHNYYDLGCSLGAGMLAMSRGLTTSNCKVIGVDSSKPMLDKAQQILDLSSTQNGVHFELHHGDILDYELTKAAMVLMNFTLQFIALEKRDDLVGAIYSSLQKGGALVLSEKIKFDHQETNQALIDIHHQYKSDQGYSDLEISQKRDAIENVLIPETLEAHQSRLENAGFNIVTPWIQNLQFISILAVK